MSEKERDRESCVCVPGEEMVEAMEVERWGEEEEVAMDIDVAQEDIAEMELVRKALTSPTKISVESFGIPADYTNDYSVSHTHIHTHTHTPISLPSHLNRISCILCWTQMCYFLTSTFWRS